MKKMKGLLSLLAALGFLLSCGSDDNKTTQETTSTSRSDNTAKNDSSSGTNTTVEKGKGIGKFTNVQLTHPLDNKMVSAGKSVYDVKCGSCHKLTEEKLVGPGWKNVTTRRTPEWIMNFITNTDEMLNKDIAAKNLYEICLVKMPNQNLSDEDARNVLEYMRSNDGQK